MKIITKTLSGTAIAALLAGTALAQTSDSATVDVTANVVAAEAPLSITIPASIHMGTLTIPVSSASTCVYGINSDGGLGLVLDESGTPNSNPEPSVCVFQSPPPILTATIECQPDITFNLTRTGTPNPAAESAGIGFIFNVADSLNGGLFLFSNQMPVFTSACGANGESVVDTLYAISIPGTAQPYSGSVGTITFDVSY